MFECLYIKIEFADRNELRYLKDDALNKLNEHSLIKQINT